MFDARQALDRFFPRVVQSTPNAFAYEMRNKEMQRHSKIMGADKEEPAGNAREPPVAGWMIWSDRNAQ